MVAKGVLKPYSLYKRVAAVKAVAVWPEGKERKSEPSGRRTPANDFMEMTTAPIKTYANAVETSIRFQLLRLFTPASFNINMTTIGR